MLSSHAFVLDSCYVVFKHQLRYCPVHCFHSNVRALKSNSIYFDTNCLEYFAAKEGNISRKRATRASVKERDSVPSPEGENGKDNSQQKRKSPSGLRKNYWKRPEIWNWMSKPLGQLQGIVAFAFLPEVATLLIWFLFKGLTSNFVRVPYSEFLKFIDRNQVQKVNIDGVHINFWLNNKAEKQGYLLSDAADAVKKVVYTTIRPGDIKTPYKTMIHNCVEFGSTVKGVSRNTIYFVVYCAVSLLLKSVGPLQRVGKIGNLMHSNQERVTFADVAGIDEAKEELQEIVEFLRNPDKYLILGARPPRGVLLVGEPGTGKTLLAKAIAGEADVPFLSCSASEFVEFFAGMGAYRVRNLFARAKSLSPSIIFIDEIDAVAKSRGKKFHITNNDEQDQTLNQLLTEMDGFDSHCAVIVIGATNRSDVLDPALRRPGRFDRVVTVEPPDRFGREEILRVHASRKKLPLSEDVAIHDIASMTTGFTGADLANLVNEAALLAGRENKSIVEKIDFIHAVERSIAGIEKKNSRLKGSEKAVVAQHEAGHAVVGTAVANILSGQPHVEKLSILPRSGGALGFTYTPPAKEDRHLLFLDELHGHLVTLFGGRAAEIVYSGRVSTGAADDIKRATDIAYKVVAEYGLNQMVGPVSIATLSEGGIDTFEISRFLRDQGCLVDLVHQEVKTLLQAALNVALSVIQENTSVMTGLAACLEEKEVVEGEELRDLIKLVVAPEELCTFLQHGCNHLMPQNS